MADFERRGEFWTHLEQLVASSQVVIDRPKGSAHPRFPEAIYPLDYGYLHPTTTVDGGGVDVWVGSQPGRPLEAVLCSVDLYKRDVEVKLLLGCTEAEIEQILAFMNQFSMRVLLVQR
jgi:inorganic pyrophosphatase